jgi:hypothetical protein
MARPAITLIRRIFNPTTTKRRTPMRYLLILLLAALISACSQSPMDALKSDVASEENMNVPFWAAQHKQHTALWDEAVAYCKANKEKPNCFAVNADATVFTKYGTSGHYLTVPSFDTQPQSAKK